ncbi:hypothetical protein [Pseudonocardia sp. DLS-67]
MDALVHLVAVERPAVRRHPSGPPIRPAHVVWGLVIGRDGTTHDRIDLPADVIRALRRDGGGPVRPMAEISPSRLNAAVEKAVAGRRMRDGDAAGPIAPGR